MSARLEKHRLRSAVIASVAALLATTGVVSYAASDGAVGESRGPAEKDGYWWYKDPPADGDAPEAPEAPTIPTRAALQNMPPAEVQKLIDAQLAYALIVETEDAVADYYRLIDFSRRRSRGFAALTQMVMLQNPELNARAAYPLTNAGRDELTRQRETERDGRLAREGEEFALVMFSREICVYCRSQWAVLQHFADKTGWNIRKIDIDEEPSVAARFGVNETPITIMIRRGTQQWFPIAVGTESYPVVADNAYRAIRFVRGEIDPKQFYTTESEQGGFFDPARPTSE